MLSDGMKSTENVAVYSINIQILGLQSLILPNFLPIQLRRHHKKILFYCYIGLSIVLWGHTILCIFYFI